MEAVALNGISDEAVATKKAESEQVKAALRSRLETSRKLSFKLPEARLMK